MLTQPRNVEFLQRNSKRREIYALLTADDGQRIAVGPLTAGEVNPVYFGGGWAGTRSPSEQVERAAEIARTRDEFHDLADFYHFYGYPADLIEWIERVPAEPAGTRYERLSLGVSRAEVAERLGIDRDELERAADAEGDTNSVDGAGDPIFNDDLWDNWAARYPYQDAPMNPNALRFKAWLSFRSLPCLPTAPVSAPRQQVIKVSASDRACGDHRELVRQWKINCALLGRWRLLVALVVSGDGQLAVV